MSPRPYQVLIASRQAGLSGQRETTPAARIRTPPRVRQGVQDRGGGDVVVVAVHVGVEDDLQRLGRLGAVRDGGKQAGQGEDDGREVAETARPRRSRSAAAPEGSK